MPLPTPLRGGKELTMAAQRILIVDDNKIFQILSKQTCKKLQPDAQIVLANNGLEALAQFQAQPFDLILT